MTSFINMLADNEWSEADIIARSRAVIDSEVSVERQNELRNIMLGHLAGMRVASSNELAEIRRVQVLMEDSAKATAEAIYDMALLRAVKAYESAKRELLLDTTLEESKITYQAVLDSVSQEVIDLYNVRNKVDNNENDNSTPLV